jgi:hypothetical protein
MNVSLGERKRIELEAKLASLEAEIAHWEQQSALNGRLEKHHTQVYAVASELAVPIEELSEQVEALDGAGALGQAEDIEWLILDLHRIWDVFRSKLALRCIPHFEDYLIGADELAYRCYRPAELRGAPREPPLVYFGDDLSPLTQLRGGGTDTERLLEPLRRLPVALIGLPWFQIEHLPDAPIIAHEVGHDVEDDLGLGAELDAAVAGALEREGAEEDRLRAWATWRGEAFADVFGTLALGPAFTRTLIDFLAAEPSTILAQFQADGGWRPHPPATLRVLLSAAALERADDGAYAVEAAQLRDCWSRTYPGHSMGRFEPDVEVVAAAIIDGPYALDELAAFPRDAHERACRDARGALKGVAASGSDARELVAAARLAYDAQPAAFRGAGVSPRLLRRIRSEQQAGTRTGAGGKADTDAIRERAQARGRWLSGYLRSHRAGVESIAS